MDLVQLRRIEFLDALVSGEGNRCRGKTLTILGLRDPENSLFLGRVVVRQRIKVEPTVNSDFGERERSKSDYIPRCVERVGRGYTFEDLNNNADARIGIEEDLLRIGHLAEVAS